MKRSPLAVFVFCFILSALWVEAANRMIGIEFGNGWSLNVFADNSVVLAYGASPEDQIVTQEEAIQFASFEANCLDAIAAAPKIDMEFSTRLEFRVVRLEVGKKMVSSHIAVFTPELKASIDKILATKLPDNIKVLTNKYPVYFPVALRSLTEWSNLPINKAQNSLPDSTAVLNINAATFPQKSEVSTPHNDQLPIPDVSTNKAEVSAVASPLGFRAWIVVALLAMAAFLAYRFIKLRSGV